MKNPEPKIKTIITKLKRVVTSDEIQLLLQNNILSMQVLNSLWNKDIDLSLPQKPVKEQKYPMEIKIYDCLGRLYRKERTDGTYRYLFSTDVMVIIFTFRETLLKKQKKLLSKR